MEVIRSRQNLLIKTCIKLLGNRRERLKSGTTLLDGTHLIESAMASNARLERVLVAESAFSRPEVAALAALQPAFSIVDDALFNVISDLDSISGIVAIVDIPATVRPLRNGFILALDGVQDPGNVGSLMRTAAAAGVSQVWLGEGCADAWAPRVLRAGMGAHFVVPVIEKVSLTESLGVFSGKIGATTLDESESLYNIDLSGDLALVVGNEGSGVSSAIMALANQKIRIPMAPGIESLNVAAAAAICLFEKVRQMHAKSR